nr:class I SAM-dependent methyltransferase [Methylocapsa palsarum]
MEGRGVYNRSSRVQAAGLSPAVALLETAACAVPLPEASKPIVIADYGSSEGRNSLPPIAAAVQRLRERIGPRQPISVVHTDMPENDFGALFQTLANDPDSYLRSDPMVFPSAIGRSFYQQILPSCSVTLGWSSWAVQWLSRTPAKIPDQLQISYSADAAARDAFARQAAEDWRTFLISRGRELHGGGRLVVVTMALRDDGDFGYRRILSAMYAALLSLVDDGLISEEEAERMAIPTLGRSRSDLEAPVLESGCCGGLAIEHLDVFEGEDLIWRQFEEDRDADAFGARWAAFSRASVFPTLALGLADGAGGARAGVFVEKLEAAMAARLAAAPEPTLIPLARIVLVKDEVG